jgi:D-amino-acid dehydrogenase
MADDAHDVVVIGAGVIGLACAFRLAGEGRRVLLLDRGDPLAASRSHPYPGRGR